jgi:hypothetical protein
MAQITRFAREVASLSSQIIKFYILKTIIPQIISSVNKSDPPQAKKNL